MQEIVAKRLEKIQGVPFFFQASSRGDLYTMKVLDRVPHFSVATTPSDIGIHTTHDVRPVPEPMRPTVGQIIARKIKLKPLAEVPQAEMEGLRMELLNVSGFSKWLGELLQAHGTEKRPENLPGMDRLTTPATRHVASFLAKSPTGINWYTLFSYLDRIHALRQSESDQFHTQDVQWVIHALEEHGPNVLTVAIAKLEPKKAQGRLIRLDQYKKNRSAPSDTTETIAADWKTPDTMDNAERLSQELAELLKIKIRSKE